LEFISNNNNDTRCDSRFELKLDKVKFELYKEL